MVTAEMIEDYWHRAILGKITKQDVFTLLEEIKWHTDQLERMESELKRLRLSVRLSETYPHGV